MNQQKKREIFINIHIYSYNKQKDELIKTFKRGKQSSCYIAERNPKIFIMINASLLLLNL